ncbi:MAG: glycoside hydrolase family 127 protein [Bryobacterales bacterium]|nr:glycoside hydrolase family 127 protein [Bryobacterales bacterium]
MCKQPTNAGMTRRDLVKESGKGLGLSAAIATALPVAMEAAQSPGPAPLQQLQAVAGVDRVVVLPGKTYLRGWVGRGEPPSTTRTWNQGRRRTPAMALDATQIRTTWSKQSGPGEVRFRRASSLETTATFSAPGEYVLRLDAYTGRSRLSSTLTVKAERAPVGKPWEPVEVSAFRVTSPFWKQRLHGLAVNWIPHCIAQINRTDIEVGPGGIDNFVEAGKKLRGEKHGVHKGYVFSNAWVYQTIEAMSLAMMLDPQGDPAMLKAFELFRATLDDWIPKILAAQEPDGYLQTAYTLPREGRDGATVDTSSYGHWDPKHRGDHEGYVAGYLLEAAISHYRVTGGRDRRLYDCAKKLADCWEKNLGPAPKKAWYDGHQAMEQALVRFGHFVNEAEGAGKGAKYFTLARFLLDCRYTTADGPRHQSEYDQSHLPVVEQYEAVGHAVRAVYTYSAMADVAIETGNADYRSAAKAVWDNLSNRKYYVTGGVGSGETSEGFGPDYSLRHRGYNESCSSCGAIFFHWKMGRMWKHGRFADLYEDTLYNALGGCMDLESRHFYYDNPLEARVARYAWHVCPCCVGNVPRTLLMLPTWTYTKASDAIQVNLYAGGAVKIEGVAGGSVEMVQETEYPWRGEVALTVNPDAPRRFAIYMRIPNRDASELYRSLPAITETPVFQVNGAAVKPVLENGYAVLARTWKAGDRVEFVLPLEPQRIQPSEKIEATRGQIALRYGPLIYNIEQADQDILKPVRETGALRAVWKPDLLGGVVAIEGQFADGSPLLAIPHGVRMNRETATAYPPPYPPPNADGTRPAPPPVRSQVWMRKS